jgi:hypothetical protein
MSGKGNSQQGLVQPAKTGQGEMFGGAWSGAWASMSDEGGVMLAEAMELKP